MKNKGSFTLLGVCLALILAVLPFVSACAKPAPGEPIVLKYVQFLPPASPQMFGVPILVDAVNEAAKGELTLQFAGGPEAIPMFEQAEAVKTGAMDMAVLPCSFYASLVPEGETLALSMLTAMEERKVGYYDAMLEHHKKVGLYYLCRGMTHSGMYLYTTKRAEKPEDLAGFKMRTGAIQDEFLKALGTAPVTIPWAEVYTALQRGVIDGFAWPRFGVIGSGNEELVKYMIDHGFYKSNCVIIMNLDKWNSLPEHLQDLLSRTAAETEPKLEALFNGLEEEEGKKLQEIGVEFVKFSAADAKQYLDMAYRVKWESIEMAIPETAPKLKAMITK